MHKPYKKPIMNAMPDIKVPEPRISKFVVFLIRLLGRLYLFLFFGVAEILLHKHNKKIILDAFKRALAGESRCILAFRHPNGGEPQLLAWFFLFKLGACAGRNGIRFARKPHAFFVYGYEVTRWGGWPAKFVMPNVGAMPIHHSKMDKNEMSRIYRAIIEGKYPLALAPEGQISYTADSVPRLENGTIRIGFNAAHLLMGKNNNCPVEILPVSVHFRYGSWGKMNMNVLLRRIEKYCGISGKENGKKLSFNERLARCRNHILEINEERYNIKKDISLSFEERLERVIYASLETAERMLDIKSEGEYFPRLYKVRQICWDRIFLPNVDSFKDIPQIERSIMDLRAGEAWHIACHQELSDFGWYFRRPLPDEGATLDSKIEYVQNLWDFANRTMGGSIPGRANIFPRKVIICTAPPINLTERLPRYKEDKKAAIAESMADLEKSYLNCIEEMKKS